MSEGAQPGELLVIFGPPAVGKMTVGRAVCERTDFRLFLNHDTIEPLVEVFGFGTPGFDTLNGEFRRRVIEEAARAGIRLIFTLVWDLQGEQDAQWVSGVITPYSDAGLRVSFVELVADFHTRLGRNRGEDRLLAKPSKRDFEWSDGNLRELEQRVVMNTDPSVSMPADDLLAAHRHLRIDNHAPAPDAAAEQIVEWLAAN